MIATFGIAAVDVECWTANIDIDCRESAADVAGRESVAMMVNGESWTAVVAVVVCRPEAVDAGLVTETEVGIGQVIVLVTEAHCESTAVSVD
jgi:hypothetical protein